MSNNFNSKKPQTNNALFYLKFPLVPRQYSKCTNRKPAPHMMHSALMTTHLKGNVQRCPTLTPSVTTSVASAGNPTPWTDVREQTDYIHAAYVRKNKAKTGTTKKKKTVGVIQKSSYLKTVYNYSCHSAELLLCLTAC